MKPLRALIQCNCNRPNSSWESLATLLSTNPDLKALWFTCSQPTAP